MSARRGLGGRVERWFRRGLATGSRALPLRIAGPRVLAYHLVDGGTASPVDIPTAAFEAQLDTIVACAKVKPLSGVGDAPNDPAVAITIDDAFRNFEETVWPRLRSRGLPATLFVPTGFIDGTHASPLRGGEQLRPCSWDALGRMSEEGLELGTHSVSHRDFPTLSDAECADELARSTERIRAMTGAEVRDFCYPRAAVDRRVAGVVARSPYVERGHVAGGVAWGAGRSASTRPRLPVRREMSVGHLKAFVYKGVDLGEAVSASVRRLRP